MKFQIELNLDCVINILKFLPFEERVKSSAVCKSWYSINHHLFDTLAVDLPKYYNNESYKTWVDKIKPKEYKLKVGEDMGMLDTFLTHLDTTRTRWCEDRVYSIHINSTEPVCPIIYKCEQLCELDMSNNFFNHTIDVSKFKHLSIFDANSTNLSMLPESVCVAPLQKMYLTFNNLRTLPRNFNLLQHSLVSLDLSNNLFDFIPTSVYTLQHLITLNFSHNDLSFIDSDISKLKKLKRLVLRCNGIRGIPRALCDMTELVHLDLGCNLISRIPDNVDRLVKLDYLDLEYNNIKAVPESLYKLAQLTHLYLTSNSIKILSDKVGNLSKLVVLYMNDNRLKNIPMTLNKLSNLQFLQLSSNKIQNICVSGLTQLEFFDIHNNVLMALPDIADLTRLKYLVIYNNLLTRVDPNVFEKLGAMKQLVINVNTNYDGTGDKFHVVKL